MSAARSGDYRAVPPSLRYGVFLPNFGPFGRPKILVELARAAEEAGWDGLFIWDHILFDAAAPQDVVDPWVALAGIAAETSRLRIGALMTPVARRRPWKLARETASLDHLSDGRLVFGAGLGFPPDVEFGLFGEETDGRLRADKLDEGLAILAGLWSGEPFAFEGKHYSLRETQFLPAPVQRPRPPVWIAGWWPHRRPFRRAARWDGIFAELPEGAVPTPDDLRAIVAFIDETRDRGPDFDVVLNGYTASAPEEAAEAVAPYLDAGLTWWLERVDPTRLFSAESALERIVAGPPAC
jgi:alkanesulfonate monooxygenase SsuD/methylene tetrahydromethanopterin reductase-like flavin-dependent oxidoreductase (luciferase family)